MIIGCLLGVAGKFCLPIATEGVQIALAELPGLPLDEAITRIQLANAMSSTAVRAGAVLTIPGR